MAGGKHKLRRVEQIKAPGLHADGEGLFLQVTVGRDGRPRRSWLVRYTAPGGQRREMGLGPVEPPDLADARDAAVSARKLAKAGVDPITKREADHVEVTRQHAQSMTFKECATGYLASREARWKSAKHGKFWGGALARYAYPVLGPLPVGAVDKVLVLQVLEPIWKAKAVTASRLRGHIEAVLSWATAHGHRSGDNPARWRGHLEYALASPKLVHQERHHPAIPWPDMPNFYASLCERSGAGADCLRFVVLTASRFSEAAGMCWGEIDFDNATWTVPKERMGKTRKPHRVALSDEAVSVLMLRKQRARSTKLDALVFESDLRRSAKLSDATLKAVLRRMGRMETVHGCRSTFRDWAADATDFPREVAEATLAHTVGNKVENAYRRGDYLDKRRALMEAWARYCSSAGAPGARVVQFPERALKLNE
ncbi:MAG: integrase arm-type DNA-binding domain-containing protein [Hyphomonadaceae bacterium]